jgi:hypothetical protein
MVSQVTDRDKLYLALTAVAQGNSIIKLIIKSYYLNVFKQAAHCQLPLIFMNPHAP